MLLPSYYAQIYASIIGSSLNYICAYTYIYCLPVEMYMYGYDLTVFVCFNRMFGFINLECSCLCL